MSGRWRTEGGDAGKHDHLLLETAGGLRLFLHDPRRFGSVDLVAGATLARFPAFVTLGPEPLSDDFDSTYLAGVFAGRRAPIKAMLLDQTAVAGLGNIYVRSEEHTSELQTLMRTSYAVLCSSKKK